MQLVSLELQDFQAHSELSIEFSGGVTCILGPSDAGKSSILRALCWVCLNDLMGDAFIRDGAKETSVELKVGKYSIVRNKGRQNIYKLDGREFASIQRDVPKAISELLVVNEINFQSQHDSPFWFAESAPEVSRRLNAVVDLSVIDTALSNIFSMVRRAADRKSLVEERLNEAKNQLEDLQDQQQRVSDFINLKKSHDELNQSQENQNNLEQAIQQIRDGRNKAQQTRERAEQITSLWTVAKEAFNLRCCIEQLNKIICKIQQCREHSIMPPDFSSVEKAHNEVKQTQEQFEGLFGLLNEIESRQKTLEKANQRLANRELEFRQQTKGKACPICKRPL